MDMDAGNGDDLGIYENAKEGISLLDIEALCLRDCMAMTANPQGYTETYLKKAEDVQDTETPLALEVSRMLPGTERTLSIYQSEKLLKVTTVRFCDLHEVLSAIGLDGEADHMEELVVWNSLKLWLEANLIGNLPVYGERVSLSKPTWSSMSATRESTRMDKLRRGKT